MADTFTSRLLLRKPEEGAYQNSWAAPVAASFGSDLLDDAITGVLSYSLTANKTLTRVNGATDEARMRVQNITGGNGSYIVTIPAAPISYWVRNASGYDQTISNGSNSVVIKNGNGLPVISDGTNIYQLRCIDYGADLPRSTGTPTNATDLVTKAYADQLAFSGALPDQSPGYLKSNGSVASWGAIASGDVTTALGYTPTSVTGLNGVQSVAAFKTGLSLNNVENKSSATIRGEFTAAANTYTAKQTFAAPAAGGAGLRLQVGTAPSVPQAGDLIPTAAGLNYYDGTDTQALGPWRQIGSAVSATGSAAVTFSSIPAGYSDIRIVLSGVSPDTTVTYDLQLSENGTNYTSAVSISSGSITPSQFASGALLINGYRQTAGSGYTAVTIAAGTRKLALGGQFFAWELPSAITHVRISVASGLFDAGTFTLYAR